MRCYSFCFSDYEISHFLGSLFIESSACMQHQPILNTAWGQGGLRCESSWESPLGPLPEVSGYFGHLSAPSQGPALMGCPPTGMPFRIKQGKAPDRETGVGILNPSSCGHDVGPGASWMPHSAPQSPPLQNKGHSRCVILSLLWTAALEVGSR